MAMSIGIELGTRPPPILLRVEFSSVQGQGYAPYLGLSTARVELIARIRVGVSFRINNRVPLDELPQHEDHDLPRAPLTPWV